MNIESQLSSSLGRRDEGPNTALAVEIASKGDRGGVQELLRLVQEGKKPVQSDAIKVLYEIAEREPVLLADDHIVFVGLLKSRHQRLVWGAMAALDAITPFVPKEIYGSLDEILFAAEGDSVIARDHAVNILIHLATLAPFRVKSFAHLLDQIQRCPVNQVPMYGERALRIDRAEQRGSLREVLESRLSDLSKDSQRRRLEKVLQKLG